jgi:hypothetical protein
MESKTNPTAKSPFLNRLLGSWLGKGNSNTKVVIDKMTFKYVLDDNFLYFQYYALEGDNYKGEGYLFFDHKDQQFQWYEFNNGWWPIRIHSGYVIDKRLILEEHSFGRDMQLIFEFLDENTVHMTEAYLRADGAEVYVDEVFTRE